MRVSPILFPPGSGAIRKRIPTLKPPTYPPAAVDFKGGLGGGTFAGTRWGWDGMGGVIAEWRL